MCTFGSTYCTHCQKVVTLQKETPGKVRFTCNFEQTVPSIKKAHPTDNLTLRFHARKHFSAGCQMQNFAISWEKHDIKGLEENFVGNGKHI